jgi:uncharacterized damage-inducible protein DinB
VSTNEQSEAEVGGSDHGAGERADLLETLRGTRRFLRYTVRDLTDEQATEHTTASELCLGGIVKHVSQVERAWARFIVEGTAAMAFSEERMSEREDGFKVLEGETLAGILDEYELVAKATDDLVESLADLDASWPLPEAPWFPPGARWSARRTLMHIAEETAHHAGHADIIRESLDGQKTMG